MIAEVVLPSEGNMFAGSLFPSLDEFFVQIALRKSWENGHKVNVDLPMKQVLETTRTINC